MTPFFFLAHTGELFSGDRSSSSQIIDILSLHRLHNSSQTSVVLPIVDNQNYTAMLNRSQTNTTTHVLPSKFLISFQYWPDANTVVRLLSVDVRTSPALQPTSTSTLILSSDMTVLYPSAYFSPWSNISTAAPHQISLVVVNGEFSSCVDGLYQPAIWNTNLWRHNLTQADVRLSFSQYLPQLAERVSSVTVIDV